MGLVDTEDGFSAESLSVHGTGGHKVAVWQVMPATAEVNLLSDEGELVTRFLAYIDDPHMHPWYPLDEVGQPARYEDYQLGAIAVDVDIFDSVEDWEAQQTPLGKDRIKLGPSFIASPWLFALYSGSAQAIEASSIAMFKAVITDVEVVTNQLTGVQWYKAVADCGLIAPWPCPLATTPRRTQARSWMEGPSLQAPRGFGSPSSLNVCCRSTHALCFPTFSERVLHESCGGRRQAKKAKNRRGPARATKSVEKQHTHELL